MATTLRPCRPDDDAFLRSVYASVRADEIALTGWDDAQAQAFLRMQFDAQHHHYRTHNPDARFDVIESDGIPAGRLYVARAADYVHVIDIALLPAWRGRGIGTALLRALMDEAAGAHRYVSIHVEINNPAQALYARLGFQEVSTAGLYRLLVWRPAPAAAAPGN